MSRSQLTHTNRIELAILLREGLSLRQIAGAIGVHHSTLSRELARNRTPNTTGYHAGLAQRWTTMRRHKANQAFRKLPANQELIRILVEKLQAVWSPQQISGWLKSTRHRIRVCTQTIYDWIYRFRKDLVQYLHCTKGKYRRTRAARLRLQGREKARASRRIDRRPASIEKRLRYGHWEGDSVVGTGLSGRIATFVERKSGYLVAWKLQDPSAAAFTAAAEACFLLGF